MTLPNIVLILGGLILMAAGLWWLWGGRLRVRGRGVYGTSGRLSEPTRLVVGLVHVLLGYHLVVWAFPADKGPLQFPRRAWYWVVVAGAGAIAASIGLDRLESSHDRRDDGDEDA